MKHRRVIIASLVTLILLVTLLAAALASGESQSGDPYRDLAGFAFPITYQGELTDNGDPEPGPCDFEITLWNALELGTRVGVTQTLNSVPLNDGRFTVILNNTGQFGVQAFNGDPRYLDISVDCPSGTGSFTPMEPRQPLTPAPYAYYSLRAASVTWNSIAAMPLDFSDGIDDNSQYSVGTGLELITPTLKLLDSYQLPQGCSASQAAVWNSSAWICVTPGGGGSPYNNVVIAAKSGGDYTTIQEAVDSITDAAVDNRYLIWVAPGVYEEAVDMKSYVDIEGAGRDLTMITAMGSSGSVEATVNAAEHSRLRYLTVENTGGDTFSTAIRCADDDFNISGVTVIASGAATTNHGIVYIAGPMTNRIDDTQIYVDIDGSISVNYGIKSHATYDDINLLLDGVTIDVSGTGQSFTRGLYQTVNIGIGGAITATNMLINVENLGTLTSALAYGVELTQPNNQLFMADSVLHGNSPNASGAGIFVTNGSGATLRNVTLEGNSFGIWIDNSGDPTHVEVHNSQVRGGTNSVKMAGSASNTLHVGASMLDGTYSISGSNAMTCAVSYDENFTNGQTDAFNSCP